MLGATVTDKHDQDLRDRMAFALQGLYLYAEALKPIRASGKVVDARFPFGM
jgi:hypothetical protein